jgi:hypothetical protein
MAATIGALTTDPRIPQLDELLNEIVAAHRTELGLVRELLCSILQHKTTTAPDRLKGKIRNLQRLLNQPDAKSRALLYERLAEKVRGLHPRLGKFSGAPEPRDVLPTPRILRTVDPVRLPIMSEAKAETNQAWFKPGSQSPGATLTERLVGNSLEEILAHRNDGSLKTSDEELAHLISCRTIEEILDAYDRNILDINPEAVETARKYLQLENETPSPPSDNEDEKEIIEENGLGKILRLRQELEEKIGPDFMLELTVTRYLAENARFSQVSQ